MTQFPPSVKFKFGWRKYQQRVLNELNGHLSDQHLHIVAPPGSGKTILGLEVIVRLNKPALILAPTLGIRNQWINRFCELFLQPSEHPEWISKDIRNPGFLTFTTYQALPAACATERASSTSEAKIMAAIAAEELRDKEDEDEEEQQEPEEQGEEDEEKRHWLPGELSTKLTEIKASNADTVAKALKDHGIQVIVVEEAHHLKNEWWVTLTEIKRHLELKNIALTATPPYDVTPAEWQRYIDFSGPVDGEISVPELMLEGDLYLS